MVIRYIDKETLYAKCTFCYGNIDAILIQTQNYSSCRKIIPAILKMLDEFSQQISSVNSNFDFRATGIRCPHASMCMDNPHMRENIHVLSQKVVREISLFLNRIIGTRRDCCGDSEVFCNVL